jgi:two-component system CheB/CheR fusion protein
MAEAEVLSAPEHGFPIVGIGASAGGLEAFTALLEHVRDDGGIALVLVQHLDPQHESELDRILARSTSMPTRQVTDGMRVERNNVYVIPSSSSMTIAGGVLRLQPRPATRQPLHVIDAFFESLAADQAECAIGVVLSGTGADGTLGLEAIKAEGGITFAQDDSARYDSMPRSAVAAGCVDFILSPAEIGNELARVASHPFIQRGLDGVGAAGASLAPPREGTPEGDRHIATAHQADDSALPSGGSGTPAVGATEARAEASIRGGKARDAGFRKIVALLNRHSGVDFSLYKSTTIQRRIARRMVLTKHVTFDGYADFVRDDAAELDTLYSDVLISVTSFFRNPEAFAILQEAVFPELIGRSDGNPTIRIWITGCSTGQEAYSMAIAFAEVADRMGANARLQIFATDLNDKLLDKARAGLYAKTLASDLSPERLQRFFLEETGGYRVIKRLREMVVFARHNLIEDPPFSRIDLVSCRNLLIYLEPALQRRLVQTFHYALGANGFLFLGASESIGPFTDLFDPLDKRFKIFRRTRGSASLPPFAGVRGSGWLPGRRDVPGPERAAGIGPHVEWIASREADRFLVNQFAPPGVLVDENLQVQQFRGATAFPPAADGKGDARRRTDGARRPRGSTAHAVRSRCEVGAAGARPRGQGRQRGRRSPGDSAPPSEGTALCGAVRNRSAARRRRTGAEAGSRCRASRALACRNRWSHSGRARRAAARHRARAGRGAQLRACDPAAGRRVQRRAAGDE